MATRRYLEAALQRQVVTWLHYACKGQPWFWTAINPHPVKGVVAGKIAKSMGAKAGVPDILIVYAGRAIFIELKAPKGRVSPEQIQVRNELVMAGATWVVCRDLDGVARVLEQCRVPLAVRLR